MSAVLIVQRGGRTDLGLIKICLCRRAIPLPWPLRSLRTCTKNIVEEAKPVEEECTSRTFIGNLGSWQIIWYNETLFFGICVHGVFIDAVDLSIFSASPWA